jgi:hypothetical protein
LLLSFFLSFFFSFRLYLFLCFFVSLQAHLGYKVTGDKVQPKVGKHKVQEVKNHKVLEPHRKTTNSPVRPGPACAALRRKKFCLCIRPSAACHSLQFYNNLFERATHAMKTISAVRSGKKDNKDICLLFFFGQQ